MEIKVCYEKEEEGDAWMSIQRRCAVTGCQFHMFPIYVIFCYFLSLNYWIN